MEIIDSLSGSFNHQEYTRILTLKTKLKAKVVATEFVAKDVIKLTLLPSEIFSYLPWQYIWLEIPELKYPDLKGNRRAFSIFNLQNKEGTIEIVARRSESGYKKTLFSLAINDEVVLYGPFGNSLKIHENSKDSIVMLAGGVGIAAFLKLIEYIKVNDLRIKCFLYYLNKNKEVTPFIERVKSLKNNNPFFDYKISYARYTADDLRKIKNSYQNNSKWWVIGTEGFVDYSYNILRDIEIKDEDLSFEQYYPRKEGNLDLKTISQQNSGINIFAKAINDSSSHTVITDINGIVLFANHAAEKITGFTQEEMVGSTPRLWGGLMSEEYYKKLWELKTSGQSFEYEIINRRKSGEIYVAFAHVSPIFSEDKKIIGFIGTEQDITELVVSEKKLIEASVFLNAVIQNIPNMIFVKKAEDLRFVLLNRYGLSLLGRRLTDFVGKNDFDLFPREQAEFFTEKDKEVLKKKNLLDIPEEKIVNSENQEIILHTKKIPIYDTDGNAKYLLGISEDITEKKQTEMKIMEKTRQLEKLNKYLVGRELKMIEMKQEVAKLKDQIKNNL